MKTKQRAAYCGFVVLLAVLILVALFVTRKPPSPPSTVPVSSSDNLAQQANEEHSTEKEKIPTASPPAPVETAVSVESPGATISGSVVDVSGNPVADAEVITSVHNGSRPYSTTSAADGTFKIAGMPLSDRLFISAWHDQLYSKRLGPMNLPVEGLSGLRITIVPTASIAGKVVDQQGRPVAEAQVAADSISFGNGLGFVKTGKDGQFLLGRLASGHYAIRVSHPHTSFDRAKPCDEVDLKAGDHLTGYVLILDDMGSLSIKGRVLDPFGKPIKHATVDAGGVATSTDDNGVYTLAGLKEGNYDLTASHGKFGVSDRQKVPAGSERVDFVLPGLGLVEGQVLSATTGQPIQDFKLLLLHNSAVDINFRTLRGFSDISEPEGRFRLDTVLGGAAALAVQAPSYAPVIQNIGTIVPGHLFSGVTVRLPAGHTAEGQVVNLAGKPLAGVAIFAGKLPPEYVRDDTNPTRTVADGSFTLTGIMDSEGFITAYAPSFAPVTVPLPRTPGQRLRVVLGQGGTIEGSVTVGTTPFAGATLTVDYPRIRKTVEYTTLSGVDGSFRLAGLPAGEVSVFLELQKQSSFGFAGGRKKTLSTLIKDRKNKAIHFRFAPVDAVLEGCITKDGKPVKGNIMADVISEDSTEEHYTTSADSTGSYHFSNLPPGDANVTVYLEFEQPRRQERPPTRFHTASLSSGKTTQLNVDFTSGTTLTGTVFGLRTGDGGYIEILQGNVPSPESSSTNRGEASMDIMPNGSFRAENLQGGTYTLLAKVFQMPSPGESIDHSTRCYGVAVVQVDAGTEKIVEITLNR